MGDLISRQAAIAHLKQRLYETQLNNDTEHPYYEEIADNRIDVWMNEVPSAQPEQKHGRWEKRYISDYRFQYYCSECGMIQVYGEPNYCPNCGARMEEQS